MKLIFTAIFILFIAFSGYHLTFRGVKVPLFARKFYLSGLEFLLIGLFFGPLFLDVLDKTTLISLEPLSALLLGWIGLLFGFQFDLSKLRRISLHFIKAALTESVITICLVLFGIFFCLWYTGVTIDRTWLFGIFIITAVCAGSAMTGLALISPDVALDRRHTIRLLKQVAVIDSLIAFVLFCYSFVFQPFNFTSQNLLVAVGWQIVVGTISCLGLIVLYVLFFSQRLPKRELFVIVICMSVLGSGSALALKLSPLFMNFLIGIVLVNVIRDKDPIFSILATIEKPVYLLILVFLGANWRFASTSILMGAIGLFLLRSTGKILGGFFITKIDPTFKKYPAKLGFGLLDQGGLSLAMLYDILQQYSSTTIEYIVSASLATIIISDLASFFLQDKLLIKSDYRLDHI